MNDGCGLCSPTLRIGQDDDAMSRRHCQDLASNFVCVRGQLALGREAHSPPRLKEDTIFFGDVCLRDLWLQLLQGHGGAVKRHQGHK